MNPATAPTAAPVAVAAPVEKAEEKTTYANVADAQKYADAKNAAPLNPGQEKRTPFKVYEIKIEFAPDAKHPTKKVASPTMYSVAQNPAYALNAASDDLGIKIKSVSGDSILPPEEYLKRLSPEQLEAARKFLGGK